MYVSIYTYIHIKFPCGAAVKDMAVASWVAAVVCVWSLAWELPHAMGIATEKTKQAEYIYIGI